MTKLVAALVALLAVLVTGALASPAAARTDTPADPFAHRALDSLRYDRTHRCTGKAQRGALALRRWLEANRPGSDWGIYNCRTTRTGSSLSLHAEGRAIDWHLDARTTAGRRAGNKLVALLLADDTRGRHFALARRMGVQELIWDCKIWSAKHPRLSRYRTCNSTSNVTLRHRDHVHIGLSWRGARKLTTFWRRAR
jgi:hypothetical protein